MGFRRTYSSEKNQGEPMLFSGNEITKNVVTKSNQVIKKYNRQLVSMHGAKILETVMKSHEVRTL